METTNIPNLKINVLTPEQYETAEKNNNEIYLIGNDTTFLNAVTKEYVEYIISKSLNTKANVEHIHISDEVIYNEESLTPVVDDLKEKLTIISAGMEGNNSGVTEMLNIKSEKINNWIITEGYFGNDYISTGE